MKDYRAGGKSRIVDYAFSNVPIIRIRYAEALQDLSDHNPILFDLEKKSLKTLNKGKFLPSSFLTQREWKQTC